MCAEFVRSEEGPHSWTQRSVASSDAMTAPAGPVAQEAPLASPFNPARAYLDRLGEGSKRTMREALTKMAGWASDGRCGADDLPWALLRIEHTAALRTRLAGSLAPATANKHLAALRGVLKECWRDGQMSAEAYQRAIDLPPVKGASPRKVERLTALELERLADACESDPSPSGARDSALFALLYGAQLRRSEAVALNLEDYDEQTGHLEVRGAKSGTVQHLVANEHARLALSRWLNVRGQFPGALFAPVNKGGRIEKRRLSEQAIYIACQKRAAAAGLRPISPEDLRKAAGDARRAAASAASIPGASRGAPQLPNAGVQPSAYTG